MFSADSPVEKAALALLTMQRHSWEQGLTMQASFERGDMHILIPLAKEAVYRGMPDGRAATIGVADAVTDPCSVGEGLLSAFAHTGDEELGRGLEKLLDWALRKAPRNTEGILYHLMGGREFWVDSMYMLPPFLAAAGFYRESLINLYGYWERLFDERSSLMHHKWDDGEKRLSREAHWGVGNGWATAAMARMYDLLPDSLEPDKQRIAGMAKTLIDSLLLFVREDWFFYNIVDDPESFIETNLTQQLAYTLYRAMASGWLPASYEPAASALRKAANSKLDSFGIVRDVCGAPGFDSPGAAPEGQAFYLLMENAADNYKAY